MKYVIYLFSVLIIGLLVLEAASRLYLFSKVPEDLKPKDFMSKAEMLLKNGSYVGTYRFKWYTFNKPKDTFRILAIGGSTTAGHRSPSEGWPYWLEEKLKKKGKFEVINLGWWGLASAQEYLYIIKHMYLDPDMVIVYDGYNDLIQANENPDKYVKQLYKTYDIINEGGFEFLKDKLYRKLALINVLNIFNKRAKEHYRDYLVKRDPDGKASDRFVGKDQHWYMTQPEVQKKIQNIEYEKIPEDLEKDIHQETYFDNIMNIIQYLKYNNIDVKIVYQPFLSEKIVRLKGEITPDDLKDIEYADYKASFETYKNIAYYAEERYKLIKKLGDDVIDMRRVFDKYENKDIYIDMCHTNAKGASIVADGLYDVIFQDSYVF